MDVCTLIGANIRRQRQALGLSQEDLAARTGVSQQYLSGLENGSRNPTIRTLVHISLGLEIGVAELLQAQDLPSG